MADFKLRSEYRELVAGFRPDSGELLACLHTLQHRFGYVPPESVPVVARQMQMTPAAVFGALSFYSEFRTSLPPKTLINWCSGPACRFKGGEEIRLALEAVLGIGMEQNTPDDRAGLHLAQCEGSCEYAPLVWLRERGAHPDGPDATLVADRGTVVGSLSVAGAIDLARRLVSEDGKA
jgi:NADH:ubiquinone oxidoreductase subunit E